MKILAVHTSACEVLRVPIRASIYSQEGSAPMVSGSTTVFRE